MSERTINTAYVTIHGDESAGIRDGVVTVSGLEYDLSIFDDEVAERECLRAELAKAFETIYGEECSVLFDFEVAEDEQYEQFAAETEARGPYYCVVCGEIEVFPLDGEDTCGHCAATV